ncbi:MAG: dephospho-CoA kinase [Acidobacteriota bacterium]
MLKVGLTGGIASGKSVVRKLLAERGAFTVDADAVVHELLGPGTELSHRVAEEFGREVMRRDGSVDRKKLGAVVFADRVARERLNRLVHPRVIAEEKRLLAQAEGRGEKVAVVDAALMIESGTYRDYDCLVVVSCSRSLQVQRLVARDGISSAEAERRIDAQLPVEEKKQYADYVVDTSGPLAETERQVEEIWKELRRQLQ